MVHRPRRSPAAARWSTWACTRSTRRGSCSATPSRRSVCATIGTRYGAYDVDDDAILLISWSQGTNSIVESGWWHPHAEGSRPRPRSTAPGYARIFPREAPSEDYEHCTQPMYTRADGASSSTRSPRQAASADRRRRPGRDAGGRGGGRGRPLRSARAFSTPALHSGALARFRPRRLRLAGTAAGRGIRP